ncbi:hypothetical protein GAMM_160094 [Gammaproteobacteria bacterium]
MNHPYLTKKQVKSHDIRVGTYKGSDNLIIPLRDNDGITHTLQFIYPEGSKRFLGGGAKKGHYFQIGELSDIIYIAEGYATAATIHEVTGQFVVVAFDGGNLLPVAQNIRKKYPDKDIVICADNDAFREDGKNVGIEKATEAAKSVGAKLVVPQFKDTTTKPTDFNDLMCLEGIDEVKKQLANAVMVKETPEEAVARLAKLPPLQYDRVREEEAKKLGVRLSTLDSAVEKERGLFAESKNNEKADNNSEIINGIEPCTEPVDGAAIANEIRELIKNHAVLNDSQIDVIALYTISTYCIDAFGIFPKLLITSPEKRCGKTTVLSILRCIVNKALQSSNTSPSAIFRAIELWRPTLLIDEGDTFISNDNPELKGIINSGHTRDTAFVLRTEGDNNNRQPKQFSTWAPMVIAMIKTPPDTILDRSVVLKLKRKLSSERITKWVYNNFDKLAPLRQKIKRWVDDNFEAIKSCTPKIPSCDNDRATDNWLPLFAIAFVLGSEWTAKVEIAFKDLNTADNTNDESISTTLLMDIKEIFEKNNLDKIHSSDLVEKLIRLEERSWNEYRHGKPITQNILAKLLNSFEIKPKQIRVNDQSKKGYNLSDFDDVFSRYIPAILFIQNETTKQMATGAGFNGFQNETANLNVSFQNSQKATPDKDCFGVSFQNMGSEGVYGLDATIESDGSVSI